MKNLNAVALAFLVALCAVPLAQADETLDTAMERLSYGIGLQIAQSLAQQGMTDIDETALALAIRDVLDGKPPRLSLDDMRSAASELQEKKRQDDLVRGEANKQAGEAFLAANGERAGVVTTESGLQYLVIEPGSGTPPTREDTVVVHYRGRLLNGDEFDSSYSRNEPTAFQVSKVVQGWQEALAAMPVGAKWEVWIPPDLAYGERGAGGRIGPNETLHFEIALIENQGKK